jgi:hypothetical protein
VLENVLTPPTLLEMGIFHHLTVRNYPYAFSILVLDWGTAFRVLLFALQDEIQDTIALTGCEVGRYEVCASEGMG